MNILITGIHGFVGSNLTKALHMQHTLYGLDIVSPKKEGIQKNFSWAELANNNIPEVDAVIHLAGKAHDTKNQTNAQVYFDINTGLTKQIFDWFLKSNASKFIFFSSVKAVADKVIGDVLTENVKPAPIGPYGESKIVAEKYILSQALSENKKVYILRPCMIHGPGNKGNLNLLYQVQVKGIPWPLGAFENKRSFCSIGNLIYAVQQLIEKEIESGIYQVADDEALATNELISIIAGSQNKQANIWRIPINFIKVLARIGDFLHLPLNSERLKKLTESYVVSNQKLKTALGIIKMPVTAEDGLKRTMESFKK
ncbi:NAD-dependent epimerase/dehydratase family protein [Roseimarinus sediminis]|uniref:NAD-dependent epimerase/dehydratase family protein n=1 Tax=Roseimarinus sediminis TaxID=1610899 RepID=UPI003D25AA3E